MMSLQHIVPLILTVPEGGVPKAHQFWHSHLGSLGGEVTLRKRRWKGKIRKALANGKSNEETHAAVRKRAWKI